MMLSTKLLEAAGNAATTPVYVEDVFSTYLYTGNGSTQVIENGINLGSSNSGGSVYFDGNGDYLSSTGTGALNFASSDFTVECWVKLKSTNSTQEILVDVNSGAFGLTLYADSIYYEAWGVQNYWAISFTSYYDLWTHIAISRSGSTSRMFFNGTEVASSNDTRNYATSGGFNIGGSAARSRWLIGNVSNLRVVKGSALYTSNFTPSTTALTAISGTSLMACQGDLPLTDKSTNAYALTVNGDAAAKVLGPFTSDTAGKGGLVWIKGRNNGWNNILQDASRGINSSLCTNNTDGAIDPAGVYLTSFNSNGFSIGTNGSVNFNTNTYASWAFREQPKFFDVVTYTGNGSAPRNIAHNLGSTPGCIIVKSTSSATNWAVYHRSLGATQLIRLNRDWASESSFQNWADTSPTSTQFTVGADGSVNASGQTYVAYLFAHDAGGFGLNGTDNVISCGTFTTDGSGNASVNLGYEPQWILAKQSNGTNSWGIYDTLRGWSFAEQKYLLPDMSIAEGTINATNFVPNATGFTTSSPYASSAPYIYIAIRKGPMRVPTSGTSVFKAQYGSSGSPSITTPFVVDTVIDGYLYGGYSGSPAISSRLTGSKHLVASSTDAESSSLSSYIKYDYSNGAITTINYSHILYALSRAPGFFDQVCYTGTGAALTLTHNLGVAPELIITKARSLGSGYNWNTWCAGLANNQYLNFNLDSSVQTYSGIFGGSSTVATATTFNVSNSATANNDSGQKFVAYLFATCPGVSKVGTFTANATNQNIECGFTSGARFILWKQIDGTGGWGVVDTARGYASSPDPYLLLNSTAAETSPFNVFNTYAGGFQLNGGVWINGTFIFLAIA